MNAVEPPASVPVSVPVEGSQVLYVSFGSPVRADGSQEYAPQRRAAIVTEVDPGDAGRVGLVVFNPTGQHFRPLGLGGGVYDASGTTPGSWHWREDG
ncbi:hypothetical protein VSR01_16110 [Actinacidiphila sp. DG2A-62]|uniref:hypothetical protein n=1 Tax=Actinacidiphila sp. DG2A-62 TaxID=3108821 RepID=UPI002DB6098A|nr:hypothetical protein [Actinacidiphila sp. DG2A-62]MEC3994969.1 hypothetical protein [Actinacidiphila sp. DG2A-62]